jgi:hypothetical protein
MSQGVIRAGVILVAALVVAGCARHEKAPAADGGPGDEISRPDALYFTSPQQAVETAGQLLEKKDWPTLARYYDLAGSPVRREELVNGSFFYSERVTGSQHPAGLSRYKHPFAPGFRFLRTEPTDRQDVTKVSVLIEIEQGGGLTQRGMSAFLLSKHPGGWQILPVHVDA